MLRTKSAWTGLVCLLCLTLAVPALAAPSAAAVAAVPKQPVEQVIGKVISVTPGAWVERLGQKIPVTQGMELRRVDVLSTDATGKVGLEFVEKTSVALGPDTRVSLESFDLRPETADLHVRMAAGTARVVSGGITKLRPEALTVFTPMATIGIRGTDCAAAVTPSKTTLVVNSIGKKDILVTNMLTLEQTSLTKPGQALVVTPEGNAPRAATTKERKAGVPAVE